MQVVEFPSPAGTRIGWDHEELRTLLAACEAEVAKGRASSWEIDVTEAGDPQLYLIGPAPHFDCVLSLSRLGRLYLLQDGEGRLIGEYRNAAALADAVRANLSGFKYRLAAWIVIVWAAAREAIEDRLEPIAEEAQAVAHVMPQLAALA